MRSSQCSRDIFIGKYWFEWAHQSRLRYRCTPVPQILLLCGMRVGHCLFHRAAAPAGPCFCLPYDHSYCRSRYFGGLFPDTIEYGTFIPLCVQVSMLIKARSVFVFTPYGPRGLCLDFWTARCLGSSFPAAHRVRLLKSLWRI